MTNKEAREYFEWLAEKIETDPNERVIRGMTNLSAVYKAIIALLKVEQQDVPEDVLDPLEDECK